MKKICIITLITITQIAFSSYTELTKQSNSPKDNLPHSSSSNEMLSATETERRIRNMQITTTQEQKKEQTDNEISHEFFIVDGNSLTNSNNTVTTTPLSIQQRVSSALHSSLNIAHQISSNLGLTSQSFYYYNLSSENFDAFIKSKASITNPHEGYQHLERALLSDISKGGYESALLLFHRIYKEKSHLTPATLSSIAQAAKKHQEDLNEKLASDLSIWAHKTTRTAFLLAQAEKIDGLSNFKPQTPEAVATVFQEQITRLTQFATTSRDVSQPDTSYDDNDTETNITTSEKTIPHQNEKNLEEKVKTGKNNQSRNSKK